MKRIATYHPSVQATYNAYLGYRSSSLCYRLNSIHSLWSHAILTLFIFRKKYITPDSIHLNHYCMMYISSLINENRKKHSSLNVSKIDNRTAAHKHLVRSEEFFLCASANDTFDYFHGYFNAQ